ncbi:MAG TPA: DUF5985 family protein [Tepidisphaeraceae bacterium]|nr:DUF5985 family protein [Tepidisphaeraceae bacterium]
MAETVYILCGLTSLLCAVLLFRGYKQSHARLLFWSALCFLGLTINNVFLFLDMVIFPDIDFAHWRSGSALIALLPLLYGLIWESE